MDYDPMNTTLEEYDQHYTADISSQMRVPQRLFSHDAPNSMNEMMHRIQRDHDSWNNQVTAASMMVPDRLLVNDIISRSPEVTSGSESTEALTSATSYSMATTPLLCGYINSLDSDISRPRTNNLYNSSVYNSAQDRKKTLNTIEGSTSSSFEPSAAHALNEALSTSLLDAETGLDDLERTRQQVARLVRHVRHLERENSRRVSRELLLYPVVISYMLFKITRWLMTQF